MKTKEENRGKEEELPKKKELLSEEELLEVAGGMLSQCVYLCIQDGGDFVHCNKRCANLNRIA